jgi:hypothetical protein
MNNFKSIQIVLLFTLLLMAGIAQLLKNQQILQVAKPREVEVQFPIVLDRWFTPPILEVQAL